MSGVAGALGLFLLLLASASDETVLRYVVPPLLVGLGIGIVLIALFEWRSAVRRRDAGLNRSLRRLIDLGVFSERR